MTTKSESLKTSHVASNSIIHVHVYLLNKFSAWPINFSGWHSTVCRGFNVDDWLINIRSGHSCLLQGFERKSRQISDNINGGILLVTGFYYETPGMA